MAIRIGSSPPTSEPAPPEAMLPEAPPPMPMDEAPELAPDKVDPMVAGYKGAEMGPFICAACSHFDQNGGCNIVSGPIDPEGVCNLFFRSPEAGLEEPAPMEPPMPTDLPPDEALPEQVS